eukprot:326651_1
MSKVSYQVLGVITTVLGATSVCGALYIIQGCIRIRQTFSKNSSNRPLFMINHVLWMSFCDVLQQGWISFSWLPVGFDGSWNANWPPIACKLTGTFAQYFLTASASWNFVIAICLMRMLRATPCYVLADELIYHHIFAWTVPLILCILPWIHDAYGYTKNIELKYGLHEFECWIHGGPYQLCLYAPAMIYVFIAFTLLIFTFFQQKAKKINNASTSLRLAAYTIIFVVTWTFPILLRLYGMITHLPPPTFIVWAHHISIASIGIGNAMIWGTSQQKLKQNHGSKSGGSRSKKSVTTSKPTIELCNTISKSSSTAKNLTIYMSQSETTTKEEPGHKAQNTITKSDVDFSEVIKT